MAKRSEKKAHPVRSLVSLLVITVLMYAAVGAGVAQLHWGEIEAWARTNVLANVLGQSSESSATPSESASESASAESSEALSESATAEAKPEESASSDPNANPEATPSESPSPSASPSEAPKPEEKKADDPVSFIPKFALDLAGGTQIILTPELTSGETVDDAALDQAIEVIRQRINASGVAEAEINKQGQSNIVVGIPGQTPSDETIKLISNAAHMRFRPVIAIGEPTWPYYSAALGTESEIIKMQSDPDATKTYDKDGDGKLNDEEAQAASQELVTKDQQAYQTKVSSDTATGTSKFQGVTQDAIQAFDQLDCSKEENRKGGSNDKAEAYLATCSQDGTAKYMLAPVAVEGEGIQKAVSGLKNLGNGKTSTEWVVSLEFKEQADDQFIAISEQIKKSPSPRNQFAITLDGLVISAPSIQSDTTFVKGNGVEISGGQNADGTKGGTEKWANTLANQLSFGALPMSFKVDSTEQVSATLGSESLEKGLLAGLFGLLLVVLYSLFQYRALGLVTIGSLSIAALLTYGSVLLLSWQMGYRLSLPGIIGFIVSIGITADSFIVYFERVRDELRDGRTLDYAVKHGWSRALRTIVASDFVNILAAVILYFLAVGGVRGFAFTLGLTTVIDFIVVCWFTHPVVLLLSRMRFFWAGHPASGLSTFHLGAEGAVRYRKLSKTEKAKMKDEQKALKLEAKELKKSLKTTVKGAKMSKKEAKKIAKMHKKQHEATMKAAVMGEASRKLTIAEKKALEAGKSIDVDKVFEGEEVETPEVKPTAVSKTAAKTATKSAVKKTAATAKPAAKPAAKKPGRPKKTETSEKLVDKAADKAPAKKPGRPRKTEGTAVKAPSKKVAKPTAKVSATDTVKRGPGRPKKTDTATAPKATAKKPATKKEAN